MKGMDRGRRLALAALAALALAPQPPASAQDPRTSEAQGVAHDWLALADAGDAGGTYKTAGKRFKDAMPADQWVLTMKRAREAFGATLQRAIVRVEHPQPGGDVPPGEFVVIRYRTEFGKRPQGNETVTLEREADGKWRVVGYLMG
ncbi:MAG: DUF4019 domain-containing protein [Burkholderiales bacterium]|nr:DUF4019 domain-containing protein [Burkholderiales bacterium]